MTRHRTTHALLVVVAVLLGLNLTLRLSPPQAAGQEFDIFADNAHPRVIQVLSPPGHASGPVYRLWSDSVVEWALFTNVYSGCVLGTDGRPWAVIPEGPAPVPHGIRVVEIFADDSARHNITRVLSNGTVQRNLTHSVEGELVWCGWREPPE